MTEYRKHATRKMHGVKHCGKTPMLILYRPTRDPIRLARSPTPIDPSTVPAASPRPHRLGHASWYGGKGNTDSVALQLNTIPPPTQTVPADYGKQGVCILKPLATMDHGDRGLGASQGYRIRAYVVHASRSHEPKSKEKHALPESGTR